MAEFDDDRALRHGGGWNDEDGGRNARENQLAHELSSQLTQKPVSSWFFGLQ
jgi:hypothetical protein